MTLEPMEILSGSLSLAAIVLSFFIGLKIASKYFEHKRREFLLVGITGIILTRYLLTVHAVLWVQSQKILMLNTTSQWMI